MGFRRMKEYTVTMTILVDSEADFFETENGHNLDVLEEVFTDLIYDQNDMKLRLIEVEYVG